MGNSYVEFGGKQDTRRSFFLLVLVMQLRPPHYSTQKYRTKTRKTTPATAPLTYIDFLFRYVASFLYFCDNMDRFCVFESSSGTEEKTNK